MLGLRLWMHLVVGAGLKQPCKWPPLLSCVQAASKLRASAAPTRLPAARRVEPAHGAACGGDDPSPGRSKCVRYCESNALGAGHPVSQRRPFPCPCQGVPAAGWRQTGPGLMLVWLRHGVAPSCPAQPALPCPALPCPARLPFRSYYHFMAEWLPALSMTLCEQFGELRAARLQCMQLPGGLF